MLGFAEISQLVFGESSVSTVLHNHIWCLLLEVFTNTLIWLLAGNTQNKTQTCSMPKIPFAQFWCCSGWLRLQGGEHCYYQGRLRESPESWAAVSTCHGLWWATSVVFTLLKNVGSLDFGFLCAPWPAELFTTPACSFFLVLRGMFADGVYTYGIEPLSNGSHPVITHQSTWQLHQSFRSRS